MNYKAVVFDLDGTLTNSNKEITAQTIETIKKVIERGVIVVLASGRPSFGIDAIARTLELDKNGGYVLSYNGARIMDYKTKETLYEQVVTKEQAHRLYDTAKELGIEIISYNDTHIIGEDKNNIYVQKEAFLNKAPILEVNSFKDEIKADVYKCLMVANPELLVNNIDIIKKRFPELNIYRSEPYFLENMAYNIDKAQSLNTLFKKLNILAEEVIACGDGYNDISMIKYAGMGVAMANAVDEVKEAANFITLSNDEDGVVYALNKLILGEE